VGANDFAYALESRVRAYAKGQRRKVRIRRNLPDRWVLVNYTLLSDLVVPAGVGVSIDWVRPSITVIELPGGAMPAELDLESVLKNLLRECGLSSNLRGRTITAHSLADANIPDKLDPPRWSARFLAMLERHGIATHFAGELFQIYRASRAKWGRRV